MATATRSKADAKARDKAKEKERAAQQKERDKAAKAKEKERAARQKEKDKAAKAKERERAAQQKEKDKAAKAKASDARGQAEGQGEGAGREGQGEKEQAAKAKDKDKAAKAKDRAAKDEVKAAKAEEKERAARQKDDRTATQKKDKAGKAPRGRSGSTRPAGGRPARDGSPKPTVHEAGWIAEELGRAGAVSRSTKKPTLAASFTTRDHAVIQRWAESRGGVPADVRGTGDGEGGADNGNAGVLRIEFRDETDRLEDVSWDAFFSTFDASDVDFLYQEFTKDGGESRFFKIVRADS